MDWSPIQDQALTRAADWLKAKDRPVFRIFGYAGTGKTTLAKHLASGVSGSVLFGAYTGKAAMMMKKAGAADARTIHSMIYEHKQDPETGLFKSRLAVNGPASKASLIVIDECSMVDEKIGKDLLSFGKPILVLGDPAQLPPIKGGGFFTDHEPDVMLTEIHRQAAENPIVRMATTIREGGKLTHGAYGDSKVIWAKDVDQAEVLAADQILVGMNKTRMDYNRRLRDLLGRESPLPVKGDRLVCLKNDSTKELSNGGLWTVHRSKGRVTGGMNDSCVNLEVLSEDFPGAEGVRVKVREEFFVGGAEQIPWQEKRGTQEFTYGYALTTHKAQGSQWPDVYLFDQSAAFRDSRTRWLYTAVTRASETITVVSA